MAFPLDNDRRSSASPDDGAKCVARAQAGDRAAFEQLVVFYTPLLMGFFFGRLSSPSDAEDLAQEVWLSVHQSIAQLRRPDRFGPWLMIAARRKLIDFYRTRAARPEVAYQHQTEAATQSATPESATPAAQAAENQLRAAMQGAIEAMPERYRIVLYLRLIHEDTSAAIARRLGVKESAIRMRLQRGLLKLREALARQGFLPPGASQ